MCFSGGASAAGGCRSRREFCFGGASRVCCSCWFCCWWSAVGRAACCGAVAVLAARWCVAFGVVLGRFSRSCVVLAALVSWLVSVSALVVGPSVVSVPGCFLGAGSVVAVALGFLVPVVLVGVVAVLCRACAALRSLGRSGLAGVAGRASRAGVCPVSRFSGSLFLRRCPFFGGERRQMRLPPQKRGYRRRNAANAAQRASNATQRASNAAQRASNAAQRASNAAQRASNAAQRGSRRKKPPPITPRPLSPPRGKREREAYGHRCGGDGGRPTGKNGFRPFPPIITGGQAPIFPDLKALWISDGGKIALRRWGVDFARSRPRRNGRKPKKRKEKKP